ncbi:hypothetical protein MY3296_008631 [Beauveria thailandica]
MTARGRLARGSRGGRFTTRDAPRRVPTIEPRRSEPEAAATRPRLRSEREIINELLFLIKDESRLSLN